MKIWEKSLANSGPDSIKLLVLIPDLLAVVILGRMEQTIRSSIPFQNCEEIERTGRTLGRHLEDTC